MEVVCELEGVLESEDRTLNVVDTSDGFLRMPGRAYLPVGVTSIEETAQAGLTAVADLLMSGGEEAAYAVERVTFASSMAEGFVVDPASYSVETLVGEAYDVERIPYLEGVR